MKLYFAPGACSLSPHIVAREAGIDLQLEKVDLKTKTTEGGEDYTTINPKGYVPALELENGELLTEGAVIVQYLADQAPTNGLLPANGAAERYRVQEWLNYIATELHKSWGNLFHAETDSAKSAAKEKIANRLQQPETVLAERRYLTGDDFTVADAYLFTVLNWSRLTDIELSPALQAYQGRVAERPGVNAALKEEGLIQ